jgi:hypothetical protein
MPPPRPPPVYDPFFNIPNELPASHPSHPPGAKKAHPISADHNSSETEMEEDLDDADQESHTEPEDDDECLDYNMDDANPNNFDDSHDINDTNAYDANDANAYDTNDVNAYDTNDANTYDTNGATTTHTNTDNGNRRPSSHHQSSMLGKQISTLYKHSSNNNGLTDEGFDVSPDEDECQALAALHNKPKSMSTS